MNHNIGLILLGFLVNMSLFAQPKQQYGMGLLLDHTAFAQKVEMTADFSNDGRRASDLPRWFSLRPYTPEPKNQGDINSCIGWAMGYAALTTQRAFERGITDRQEITQNAYSALFIYNSVKEGSCLSGAYIQKAAAFLKEKGDCRSADFDFPYSDCTKEPEAALFDQSQEHAIKDYVALFKKDTPPKTKVMRTKRSIAVGKPVVVGMRISESLKKLNADHPVWKPRAEYDRNLGGHALAVVGYNDSLGVFEVMNSWGVDWGEAGFFYVGYQDFTENATQALQLILAPVELNAAEKANIEQVKSMAVKRQKKALLANQQANKKKEKAEEAIKIAAQLKQQSVVPKEQRSAQALLEQAQALIQQAEQSQQAAEIVATEATTTIIQSELKMSALAGDFQLRVPLTDEFGTPLQDAQNEFQFEVISTQWNGKFYSSAKTNWEEGDMFQLLAQNIKEDSYVYLFSLDANNKVEIHWPRNQRFVEDLNGGEIAEAGQGALVAHGGAEIIIPGSDRVLIRENLKEDYICLLYSAEKIENFQERVLQVKKKSDGSFLDRFQAAFQDILAPLDQIEYAQDRMQCRMTKLDRGTAIPLIIKLENE